MPSRVLVLVVLTLSIVPLAIAAFPEPESAPQDPQRAESARRDPIEETVKLGLVYQDGDWRINLYDFLGMSRR